MVEITLDRTDTGSVATILVGDAIVVRVSDGPEGQHWTVEDPGALVLAPTERLEGDAQAGERLLRFRAAKIGETTLRLALVTEGARVVDTLVLVVEVHAPPPASARHLLRKKN